jgi:hypothetical protein
MFFEEPRKASRDLRFPIQDFIQKRPDFKSECHPFNPFAHFKISLHGGNRISNVLLWLQVMPTVCKNCGFHGIVEDPVVLWDMMLRCRINLFLRCFEGSYCRHLKGLWVPGWMLNVGYRHVSLLLRFWKAMGKWRASQRGWLKMKIMHVGETSGNAKLATQCHTSDDL